jgi:hypothetical protein
VTCASAPNFLQFRRDAGQSRRSYEGARHDGLLIDMFCDWMSDEAVRNPILADNAGRLYGFED